MYRTLLTIPGNTTQLTSTNQSVPSPDGSTSLVKCVEVKVFIGMSYKMSTTQILKDIFLKSIESVQPSKLIQNHVTCNCHLSVCGKKYQKPCYLVGFGKAVMSMALQVEQTIGSNLQMGVVTVPEGILKDFTGNSRIKFIEGAAGNIPDLKAMQGAQEIAKIAESLQKDDLLLVLISGGGSALLPLPKPPIKLEEKQNLIKELSKRGADIKELNTVRKKISLLKGGGLSQLAFPAQVVGLVLSDVVGDPLDFIASGPTTANLDGAKDAEEVLKKYNIAIPESVKQVLSQEVEKKEFNHVDNYIIGSNRIAAEAAKQRAQELGFQSVIMSTSITGDVSEVSRLYGKVVAAFVEGNFNDLNDEFVQEVSGFDMNKKICVIGGGEPTVVVKGTGKGGRNQHLALDLSIRLNGMNVGKSYISFLSGGTDGMDGPTDAAGAIGTCDLLHYCTRENINAGNYLDNNDSYGFYSGFQDGEYLVKTGHTGTNVMDVHILLIIPENLLDN